MSAYQTAHQVANQGHGTSPLFWIIYLSFMTVIFLIIFIPLWKNILSPFFKALKNWIKHWSNED